MIGVKLTVLMGICSIIYKLYILGRITTEDHNTLIEIIKGTNTKYNNRRKFSNVLFALEGVGVIYSVVYLLFFY